MRAAPTLAAALADRYRLERELGAGGMATVYLARDLKHDRHVAVKVLRPELAASLGPERFLAEIRLTAKLQHPHIVPLFDSGGAGGFLYYVMPFIEGESLRARLERERRLDVEAMLAIARPVAQALAYAHELGVVHRDIKPENILLSRGQPFVTDFGIARAVSAAGGERLTVTGLTVGTPAYMSPEQALGETEVDARSDVYALGCVIYEVLSGSPPFSGATVQGLIARRLAGPPPHLTTVPGAVDEVVRRSLATAPQDRFATAAALADALVEAARKPATPELSIVVLPFENLSPDPDQEFFADGLTEEVISDLSAVRALRVIARSSAMTFKGSAKRAAAIAGELNVRYVLEGSVRRAGNNLRITAQLIDATTDAHVWAGKYPGTLDDVFDIQEKVSAAIVEALRLALTPEEQQRMAERPIADLRAYEWYLKAREALFSFTEEGLQRALSHLDRALEATGPNPLLYAGMALAHWQRVNLGFAQEDAIAEAEACVAKALAMEPGLAPALAVRGMIELSLRGGVQDGVRTMMQALAAQPDEEFALAGLAVAYLQYAGKVAPGARIVDQLERVDPLNFMTLWCRGALAYYGTDFERAVACWERLHAQEPGNQVAAYYLGVALATAGRTDQARRVLDPLRLGSSDHAMYRCGRLLASALAGDAAAVEAELTPAFRRTAARDAGYTYHTAQALALVGSPAAALEWLESACRMGFINYPLMERDPLLAGLRGERRFQELMECVKHGWETFEP